MDFSDPRNLNFEELFSQHVLSSSLDPDVSSVFQTLQLTEELFPLQCLFLARTYLAAFEESLLRRRQLRREELEQSGKFFGILNVAVLGAEDLPPVVSGSNVSVAHYFVLKLADRRQHSSKIAIPALRWEQDFVFDVTTPTKPLTLQLLRVSSHRHASAAPGPTANSSRPPSRTSSAERTHSSHHSEHRHPSYLDPTSSSSSAKAGQDPKARGRHSHSSTQGHGPRRGSLSRTASNDSGSRPAEKPVEALLGYVQIPLHALETGKLATLSLALLPPSRTHPPIASLLASASLAPKPSTSSRPPRPRPKHPTSMASLAAALATSHPAPRARARRHSTSGIDPSLVPGALAQSPLSSSTSSPPRTRHPALLCRADSFAPSSTRSKSSRLLNGVLPKTDTLQPHHTHHLLAPPSPLSGPRPSTARAPPPDKLWDEARRPGTALPRSEGGAGRAGGAGGAGGAGVKKEEGVGKGEERRRARGRSGGRGKEWKPGEGGGGAGEEGKKEGRGKVQVRVQYSFNQGQITRAVPLAQYSQVGVIGAGGRIGRRVLRGLMQSGLWAPDMIIASTRTPSKLDSESHRGVQVCFDNEKAVAESSLVILCCLHTHLLAVSKSIQGKIPRGTLLLSMVAGVSRTRLCQLCGTDAILFVTLPASEKLAPLLSSPSPPPPSAQQTPKLCSDLGNAGTEREKERERRREDAMLALLGEGLCEGCEGLAGLIEGMSRPLKTVGMHGSRGGSTGISPKEDSAGLPGAHARAAALNAVLGSSLAPPILTEEGFLAPCMEPAATAEEREALFREHFKAVVGPGLHATLQRVRLVSRHSPPRVA